ncbi:MAG: hypothetical protein ACJ71R_19455 [Nitrososphaeraceae archaeon]
MTLYVVRAKPKGELMADLRKELKSGKISTLKPSGGTATRLRECKN